MPASFVFSEITAEYSKLYSDGELVKKCLVTVVDILCLNSSNDMHIISLSCYIYKPAKDIEHSLRDGTSKYDAYTLAKAQ